MGAQIETTEIHVERERILGTMLAPQSRMPGVLFGHCRHVRPLLATC